MPPIAVKAPALPPDEEARLEELASLDVLEAFPGEEFEELVRLAATLCGVPMGWITFVTRDEQVLEARVGIDQERTDREVSFCGHAILEPGEPLVVPDAREDERFRDNPLVVGDPGLRFYAGTIATGEGHAIGTVCVADREPGTLSDAQLEGLATIADQIARRLEELHEGLREYAEVTQGHVAEETVDLTALAREVLAERSSDVEADGGRARVGELGEVRGDPEQLRQLFAELVDNAIAFAGEDPVEIEVTASRGDEAGEVRVTDAGVGFDDAHADRIFGIFQQLDPSSSEGVGVGLTICRRIVENHGGRIRAESTPGEGATVAFTLNCRT